MLISLKASVSFAVNFNKPKISALVFGEEETALYFLRFHQDSVF